MTGRRLALGLVAVSAAASLAAPAQASLYCSPIGPVPGYGPVCTVKCLLGGADVDVKDVEGTVMSIVGVACPA